MSENSKKIKRAKAVKGKAVVTDNEVNLADNEDGTWDLYGYIYGYGNAGSEVVEEKTNPEVAEGVDGDSDIDDIHEDELSDYFDNLLHEHSDDDDELKAPLVDNGAGDFEVTQGNHKHVVKKYVHPLLQRSSNLKAYQYMLPGVVGRLECPNTGKPDVNPPPDRKMSGQPPVKRKRDAFEGTGDRKLPKMGQVKRCKHCRQTCHNISTCPELGTGKVAAAPKPGTSSAHIIAPPRKNVGSSSSQAPQVKSTSQLTQPAHPTCTSNKVTSKTQPNHPSQTTQPTHNSNKVKSTSQPTPSSPRPTTRSLSQGKKSAHLAPPPLYLGHSRFKRSGMLSIPGRKDWKVVDDKRKGKEKVAAIKAKT
ncbi:hypothetical protein ACFE04_016949 [Oxalis oulophora]